MDINQDPKDVGVLSTRAHDALARELITQLNMYQLYLTSSLGCGCCKLLKSALNSDHHQHVVERQQQLQVINNMMKKPLWMPHDVEAYIDDTMAPFNSQFGQIFFTNCKKEIAKFKKTNPQEILQSRHGCVVCQNEDATVVVQPCGHKAYCSRCNQSLTPELKKRCSLCNQPRERDIVIKLESTRNVCINCGEKNANIYNDCGHLVVCSDCVNNKKLVVCPLCDVELKNIQKVRFNTPPIFPEWEVQQK